MSEKVLLVTESGDYLTTEAGDYIELYGYPEYSLYVDWNGDGDEDLLVSSSYGVCYLFERSYIDGGYAEAVVVGIERRPQ